jgi:hypothetical protein
MLSKSDIDLIDSRVAKNLATFRDEWLAPKGAAGVLDCHTNTIAALCRAGSLTFCGEGRARRISRASINNLMANGKGIAAVD